MPKSSKKKDPNKPKGKKGAYIFFLEERRLARKDEKLSFPDFSRETSEEWKKLTAKDKEKFEKLALADKKRYEEEMADYSPPSSDEDEDAGKKKRKKKKQKDPNQPKRNMSSYFHFCSEHRPSAKDDNPGASVGDLAKILSDKWKELTNKQKVKYEELARKDKERYLKEMDVYNSKNPSKKVRKEE